MQMVAATFVYFNTMSYNTGKFSICIIGEVCCLLCLLSNEYPGLEQNQNFKLLITFLIFKSLKSFAEHKTLLF